MYVCMKREKIVNERVYDLCSRERELVSKSVKEMIRHRRAEDMATVPNPTWYGFRPMD